MSDGEAFFYKARIFEQMPDGNKRMEATNWLPSYEAAHNWIKAYTRSNKTFTYTITHESGSKPKEITND